MGRKSKKSKSSQAGSQHDKIFYQDLARHFAELGIIKDRNINRWSRSSRAPTESEIRAYKNWCQERGFTKTLDKPRGRRSQEVLAAKREGSHGAIEKRRLVEKNPRRTLQQIFRGEVSSEEMMRGSGPFYKVSKLLAEISDVEGRKCLEALVMRLFDKTDLLERRDAGHRPDSFLEGILRLAKEWPNWVRSPKTWKPKSHNDHKQFFDLARHLLSKYEMPNFLGKVWFHTDDLHQNWYKHLGRGGNIRTAKDLPIPLTKKMAHSFLKAPQEYTIQEALRWGQIHGMGGNKRIVEALRGTRICQGYGHNDFWETVIRYFIRHAMLDTAHYGSIIDYVHHIRFVPRTRLIERGVIERDPPEQPNLTMKDRDPETLLEEVDKWHTRLAKEKKFHKHNWEPCGINDFYLEEGSFEKNNLRVWRIVELLSTAELRREGKEMGHCVGSYTNSCASGRCAIYSMTREVGDGMPKNALTIEVRLDTKLISQISARFGKKADNKMMNIMGAWAHQEGLQIASYVRR